MGKRSLKWVWVMIALIIIGICRPRPADAITIAEEEELSRRMMAILLTYYELIDDPQITDYVNQVGQRIVSVLPSKPFRFRFYVIQESTYNAFATPAGHIFIHSGLLAALDSEEELAGILAHEIAHVACRHISQKIEQSKKIQLATLAGMAAGIFLGAKGAGAVGNAVTVGSMATGQSLALAYSRENELQADQLGFEYLAEANYSGQGLLTSLKKIRSQKVFTSKEIPDYLSTHPAVDDRIAHIDSWLEQNSAVDQKGAQDSRQSEFSWIRARLEALYGDENAALRDFDAAVEKKADDAVSHYGRGLVLARMGDRTSAARELQKALKYRALDPYLLADLGRIYFLGGDYTRALDVLESATALAPDNPAALFYLGRIRMDTGHLDQAADIFENLLARNPDEVEPHYFLGETYGKLGNLEDAHYHLGIYYKAKRNFKNALYHLQKALALTTDLSRTDTLKELIEQTRNLIKRFKAVGK